MRMAVIVIVIVIVTMVVVSVVIVPMRGMILRESVFR